MTQKFNKSVRKMRVSLEEVEESRRVQMTKKVEEKRELMAGLSLLFFCILVFLLLSALKLGSTRGKYISNAFIVIYCCYCFHFV